MKCRSPPTSVQAATTSTMINLRGPALPFVARPRQDPTTAPALIFWDQNSEFWSWSCVYLARALPCLVLCMRESLCGQFMCAQQAQEYDDTDDPGPGAYHSNIRKPEGPCFSLYGRAKEHEVWQLWDCTALHADIGLIPLRKEISRFDACHAGFLFLIMLICAAGDQSGAGAIYATAATRWPRHHYGDKAAGTGLLVGCGTRTVRHQANARGPGCDHWQQQAVWTGGQGRHGHVRSSFVALVCHCPQIELAPWFALWSCMAAEIDSVVWARPGPGAYSPGANWEEGPAFSMTPANRPLDNAETPGPGPGGHNIPEASPGPAFSILGR